MTAIIKYNAGNIMSVQNALERLGYESIVTDDHAKIENADKVIFPGVGEASSAMNYLKDRGLDEVLKRLKQPVLGICLGMQLMCRHSEEGDTKCLGIFDSKVKKFPATDIIPHMGWNNFSEMSGTLFSEINTSDDVYYVHSFFAELCNDTSAVCEYILPFSSALEKDNFYGTQFHPEKSAEVGTIILQNFMKL
jgi:glutamine amidotransferase